MPSPQDRAVLRELMHASQYNPSLLQFRSTVSAHQYLRAYNLVRKYIPPGATVLDWGTGNGHFAYFLTRAGYRTTAYGFDGPPQACAALSPARYSFTQGSATDPVSLPFSDQAFDGVVSIGVLEHVRETGGNEPGSLAEIRRILRPGGVFLCFHLPNHYSLIELGLRLTGRYAHPYRYVKKEIAALTAQAGLDLLEVQRYAALPRNLWGSLPWLRRSPETLARVYDTLDDALVWPLAPICQCYLFVALRPRDD